ncbi:MAG: hypothetical protein KC933_16365 [Myxococcales bacterium]|nr:hypothetical protein [Myxococcales bacterium]
MCTPLDQVPYRCAFAIPLLAAILLGACAHVRRIEVRPDAVCANDLVELSWEASGRATLSSEPNRDDLGNVEEVGTRELRFTTTSTLTLVATGFFEDTARGFAQVRVAQRSQTFGEVAECDEVERRLVTTLEFGHHLSPRHRVAVVRNLMPRPLIVEKDGQTTRINGLSASRELAETEARGVWRLSSPLAKGETCEEAFASVRSRLQVTLTLECGGRRDVRAR